MGKDSHIEKDSGMENSEMEDSVKEEDTTTLKSQIYKELKSLHEVKTSFHTGEPLTRSN